MPRPAPRPPAARATSGVSQLRSTPSDCIDREPAHLRTERADDDARRDARRGARPPASLTSRSAPGRRAARADAEDAGAPAAARCRSTCERRSRPRRPSVDGQHAGGEGEACVVVRAAASSTASASAPGGVVHPEGVEARRPRSRAPAGRRPRGRSPRPMPIDTTAALCHRPSMHPAPPLGREESRPGIRLTGQWPPKAEPGSRLPGSSRTVDGGAQAAACDAADASPTTAQGPLDPHPPQEGPHEGRQDSRLARRRPLRYAGDRRRGRPGRADALLRVRNRLRAARPRRTVGGQARASASSRWLCAVLLRRSTPPRSCNPSRAILPVREGARVAARPPPATRATGDRQPPARRPSAVADDKPRAMCPDCFIEVSALGLCGVCGQTVA